MNQRKEKRSNGINVILSLDYVNRQRAIQKEFKIQDAIWIRSRINARPVQILGIPYSLLASKRVLGVLLGQVFVREFDLFFSGERGRFFYCLPEENWTSVVCFRLKISTKSETEFKIYIVIDLFVFDNLHTPCCLAGK